MKNNSTMEKTGYGLVMAIGYLGKGVFMLLAFVGKALVALFAPLARAAVQAAAGMLAPKRAASSVVPTASERAPLSVQVPVSTGAVQADAGPDTVIHSRPDFAGCDRIVSLRLDPPVGVINLRVFYAAGVVKRDLIVSEPHLKALMGGRRHSFPDARYERIKGMDEIKDETIALAERLINDLGNRAVKGMKPRKDDFERARQSPAPLQPAQAAQREPVKTVAPPAVVPQPPAPPHAGAVRPAVASRMVSPTITTGFTYEGRLTTVGPQMQHPQGKRPFEVFEATLLLDNGAELSLRGAELERELLAAGCQIGNRVAITPMGKVPVQLADGAEGRKNLYRVANLADRK